jgi:hypothetical protein
MAHDTTHPPAVSPQAGQESKATQLRSNLLICAGLVLILGAGLVQGVWTDRWTVSQALAEACERLQGFTPVLAGWTVEEQELADAAVVKAEISGYKRWRCVRQRDGQVHTVLLLCGRPGPLSVHTPDVCYSGAGYQVSGKVARTTVSAAGLGAPAEFWTAIFRKENNPIAAPLRIYWSWHGDASWKAADYPRLAFRRSLVLHKLYVVHETGDKESDESGEALLQFLLAELERKLFAPE